MARPLRLAYENALYHVINRGHRREAIFTDDKDREEFLGRLAVAQVRFNLVVHGYCLMDNHYHLLVGTPDANLSRAMHTLNSSYASWYRARHQLVGSLFQGRFKAVLVERERYLATVSAYIHLNPVRAGLVSDPGDWRWSSMAHYLGKKPPAKKNELTLAVTTDEVMKFCGGRKNYLAIIDEVWTRKPDAGAIYGANSLLGGDDFVDEMKMRLREAKDGRLEHMPEARDILRNDPERIERAVRAALGLSSGESIARRRGGAAYKTLVWALRRYSTLRLDQIGARFGVKASAVSELVRRVEKEAAADKRTRKTLELVATGLALNHQNVK
ncbi:MAG TPA: transposase [bacterium]|nr:transposase [bacterium]